MTAPHTPGPWTVNKGEHCGARIDGPNGRSVAHAIQRDPHPSLGQGITQDEAEANARRIVLCVNVHDELVQVAKDFSEAMGELGLSCECGEADCRTTRLRAALAKVDTPAPTPAPAQFLGMSDDEEPMARYHLPGGL